MSDAETGLAFVLAEARPAMLATIRADGSPHLAPVWIDVDGADLMFNTGAGTAKGRHLEADPRVALSVQDDRFPYSYVTAFGMAELSDDLAEVKAWATRLGARYLGADRGAETGERNGVPGELLVRVRVTRWVAALKVAEG